MPNSRDRLDHPERLPIFRVLTNSTITTSSLLINSDSTENQSLTVSSQIQIGVEPKPIATTTTIGEQKNSSINQIAFIEPQPIVCSEFYVACRCNDIEKVKQFFRTIKLDEVDRLEPNGSTALHAASYHGHTNIVKLLLEFGADRAIMNKYNLLPFDEAANDNIKMLFFRIQNTNRLASNTGAAEWELIHESALDVAAEENLIIISVLESNPFKKMFECIEKRYIGDGLNNLNGIETIKRFFRKATEELNPIWLIKAYTAETDFYKALNTEMACGSPRFQRERRYIVAIMRHHPILERMSYTGCAYRMLKISRNHFSKYQIGAILMTKSFVSSSIDENLLPLFLFRESSIDGQTTEDRFDMGGKSLKLLVIFVYIVKNRRSALHIENLSQYANEGEILIMPYTVFKVKNILTDVPSLYEIEKNQSITKIELEECDIKQSIVTCIL